jgi:predicted DNA-binding protein
VRRRLNMSDKSSNMVGTYLRLEKETRDKINIIAKTRGETVAEVIRRILEKGLNEEIAEQSLDTIISAVRKTVRAELKTTENRLAKLSARSAIAAGTTMYMQRDTLQAFFKAPDKETAAQMAQDRLDNARKMAVHFLRNDEGDEDI